MRLVKVSDNRIQDSGSVLFEAGLSQAAGHRPALKITEQRAGCCQKDDYCQRDKSTVFEEDKHGTNQWFRCSRQHKCSRLTNEPRVG